MKQPKEDNTARNPCANYDHKLGMGVTMDEVEH